ncbi:A24 family peptidase [Candidatus Woesearchaeota archaeon]|nr:MAG: A24 family peptidase [Candidatus Woesearchaeota archaeon]
MDVFSIILILAALLVASYTDIKTREVPNWLNYSLIATGIGLGLIKSSTALDWNFALTHLLGLAAGALVGCAMFYAGQWGGGDSKMIIGLGAIIGLPLEMRMPFFADFLINTIVIGAFYGLAYSFFIAFKHKKAFLNKFSALRESRNAKRFRNIIFFCIVLILVSTLIMREKFYLMVSLVFSVFLIMIWLVWLLVKAIEESCMLKMVDPEQLTEGDWIVKDIIIDKKRVCGPKDLGISKDQIKQLIAFKKQKKISKVLIKEGIPFVPSFLFGFVITVLFGNLILLLL